MQCLSTINMVFSDRRGQDFDKKFAFEGVHSKEIDRRILKVSNFLKCNLFAFSSISAEHAEN